LETVRATRAIGHLTQHESPAASRTRQTVVNLVQSGNRDVRMIMLPPLSAIPADKSCIPDAALLE
jgi:hypothetical protein